MSDPLQDPRALPLQVFTTAASLLDLVDKKVVLTLRDGRTLFGMLRSFDSFGNVVIQNTVERIHLDGKYGEKLRGVWIVRGENVAMLGEVDPLKDGGDSLLATLTQIDFEEAEKELELQKKQFDEQFDVTLGASLAAGLDPTKQGANGYLY